jgi:chemotaxis signal transduction protein
MASAEQLPPSSEIEAPALVAVPLGEARYLVSVHHLEEVASVQGIARLGLMPRGVVGLANFRGAPRTLIDTPAVLGHAALVAPGTAWALIVREGDLNVALLFPELKGLFPAQAFPVLPDRAVPHPWVSAVRQDDQGETWFELDVPRVLATLTRPMPVQEPMP